MIYIAAFATVITVAFIMHRGAGRIARLEEQLSDAKDAIRQAESARDKLKRDNEFWFNKWSDAQVELGKFDRARAPNGRFVRRQ